MARNCEAFRAQHGANAVICHYFPSMVREACQLARKRLVELGSIKVRLPKTPDARLPRGSCEACLARGISWDEPRGDFTCYECGRPFDA
jgi:hypothetical protein